jgi:hypothetical protein
LKTVLRWRRRDHLFKAGHHPRRRAGATRVQEVRSEDQTEDNREVECDLISQWREASVPHKPNQKAKEDLRNLVRKYMDGNGNEPGIIPAGQSLFTFDF